MERFTSDQVYQSLWRIVVGYGDDFTNAFTKQYMNQSCITFNNTYINTLFNLFSGQENKD